MIASPELGIVIVSWNTCALLANCLRSLPAGLAGMAAEVVVVDNASSDGSADLVARDFPSVRLLRNAENVGFARGNNQAMAALPAGGDPPYVLLLNSDTIVAPGSLRKLVRFMAEHREAGAVSPRLVRLDGQPQAFAFGRDPAPIYLVARALSARLWRRPLHDWGTDKVQAVDWVSGACLLARREAIAQVGLLDESFFMYFEDNDWCLRMRRAGWRIYYCPQVEVTHLGGQSLARNPRAQLAYRASLRRFYAKHYGPLATLLLGMGLRAYNALGK